MYNNIGLQTPRGSGTSGYIMANKAKAKPQRSRLEFLKELKQLRENVLPPPRKANEDIVNHMEKREIYVKLAQMRAIMIAEGKLSIEETEQKLKETEQDLLKKFESGELRQALNPDSKKSTKDTHALALIKEQEQSRLKNAFRVDGKYEFGSAFDFDNQEKIRLEKAYKREVFKMEKSERKKQEAVKRKEEKKLQKKQAKEKLKKKKQRRESRSSSSSSASSSGSSRSRKSSSGSSSGSSSSGRSSSSSSSSSGSQDKEKGKQREQGKSSSAKVEKGELGEKRKGMEGSSKHAKERKERERSRSREKGVSRQGQESARRAKQTVRRSSSSRGSANHNK
jgi:serine/arginine repetitive matrix protein 2